MSSSSDAPDQNPESDEGRTVRVGNFAGEETEVTYSENVGSFADTEREPGDEVVVEEIPPVSPDDPNAETHEIGTFDSEGIEATRTSQKGSYDEENQ